MGGGLSENSDIKIYNDVDFKRGLGIPIGLGLGGSLFSLIVLTGFFDGSPTAIVYFFALMLHICHLILWPSSAMWLIVRGRKLENLPLRGGALLSLKLYAGWMVLFVLPFAWFAYNFNGIV